MTGPAELLELARSTAREAAELVVNERRKAVEVADTKTSPTDIVTAADLASERLIRDRILSARPGDGFVGEEGDDIPSTSGVTWVADPIDGTVNYLYGMPHYAVSIAARTGTEILAGVITNPATGETFSAAKGQGTWLDGQQLHVSSCDDPQAALVGTGFGYRAEQRARQAVETGQLLPRVRDIRRGGSAALDLSWVAAARLDAYVERGLHDWDLAAGKLLVEEAGGRVEGLRGEKAGELIVVAAPMRLFDRFHDLLLACGYGD